VSWKSALLRPAPAKHLQKRKRRRRRANKKRKSKDEKEKQTRNMHQKGSTKLPEVNLVLKKEKPKSLGHKNQRHKDKIATG